MTSRLVKTWEGECKQLDDKGAGVAVIATLGVVDKDGDVTTAGAFGVGQTVPLVPAHNWQHVPLGKGKIREEGNEALIDFQLNMKLGIARAWHEALKFDLETPPAKQEWSYGFSILDSGFGEHEGQRVRFLKGMRVHEVSPVLLGAGVNTRTLALKTVDKWFWIPLSVVEKLCPPCAEKMRAANMVKISIFAFAKQGGFTCPKPFATFQECVDKFAGDVADPEAFCAAWEEFCGERAAEIENAKELGLIRKATQDYWALREKMIKGTRV